jgi:short-subunit dehydrogenase
VRHGRKEGVDVRTLGGKRVLVTGAASGIGKALAGRMAREGAHLLLVDLDEASLEATGSSLARDGAVVRTWRLDVTDVAAIAPLREDVHRNGGPIDVLVNNAGVVFGGPFLEVPLERHLLTYRVNVLGLVAMTYAFLPDLLGRPDAHVVNVASASGFIGLPYGSTYASSKWAVIGFSESLRLELELLGHRHVHVTTVCPSYVSTGLFEGARAPVATRLLTPDRLADTITRAVLADRLWVRTPWLVKVTPMLKGILPTRLFYRVAGVLGVNTSMTSWKGRGA